MKKKPTGQQFSAEFHKVQWALGSLLFLLYVNEIGLPAKIKSSVRTFCWWYKTMGKKYTNEEDEQILQQDLDRLEDWSEK